MARLRASEVILATDGELLRGSADVAVEGVSIDSRTILPGELFVCIIGQEEDGHRFAAEAVRKGAAGLLLSSRKAAHTILNEIEPMVDPAFPVLLTEDTLLALQELGRMVREKSSMPVIAVTGSNGKTTTKELIVGILEQRYQVLKSEGNLNNLIGLPLTILKMNDAHNAAVLEMGMNSPGEIGRLSSIAKPNIGVITNISAAHLGGLGSIENIIEAKGELVDYLGGDDTLVLNVKDPLASRLAARVRGRIITFGNGQDCSVRCMNIENKRQGCTTFVLEAGDQSIPVELGVPGGYNAYNAAAAAAVGLALKMEPREIKEGLESYKGLPMRSEILKLGYGVTVYNDCYNANPVSMEEALKTFAGLTPSDDTILVLGDMLELGEESKRFHRDLGRQAAAVHPEKLLAVGDYADEVLWGAREEGLAREKTFSVGSAEEAAELIPQLVDEGQWVMVKGSRGMRLEKVVDRLTKLVGNN